MRRLPTQGGEKMLAKIKDKLPFILMVTGLVVICLGLVMFMSAILSGCGEYGGYYGGSYDDSGSSYSSSSCAGICERHCGTCWSWASDILTCETRCETLCRQRGCDYISVYSQQCDDAFQSTCS